MIERRRVSPGRRRRLGLTHRIGRSWSLRRPRAAMRGLRNEIGRDRHEIALGRLLGHLVGCTRRPIELVRACKGVEQQT